VQFVGIGYLDRSITSSQIRCWLQPNSSESFGARFRYGLIIISYSLVLAAAETDINGLAALFYSPVDCTDASDMHHSNASLMHR